MKPGEPLPSFSGLRWIRGATPKPGMLVALDFVAHWSEEEPKWRGPTSRMARAWAKNVALIEVLVFEEERGANARLASELPHPRVAVDASGALSGWLKARGVDFLPESLLFGRDGKLLFSGQPFELPGIVPQILAGRFDGAQVYELQQKRDAELTARRKLVAKITELEKAGKWREAVGLIDAEAEKFVPENRAGLLVRRFKILHQSDVSAALAYGNALEREPISQSFAWLLHDLALEIAEKPNPSQAERAWGIALTERLCKKTPMRPSYWDTLAELKYKAGDVAGALVAQENAARNLENQLDLTDSERESILRWRAIYRAESARRPARRR